MSHPSDEVRQTVLRAEGDGEDAGDNQRPGAGRGDGGSGRINVGGSDDSVLRIQLAARWAESFASERDSMAGMLRRFRTAYEYLDAVTHGVEPQLLPELPAPAPAPAPLPQPQPAPRMEQPVPAPVYAPQPPQNYPYPYPPQHQPQPYPAPAPPPPPAAF